MILSDITIRDLIKSRDLITIPGKPYDAFPEEYEPSIQPASYDLRLGAGFKYPVINKQLSTYNTFDSPVSYESVDADYYMLRPHAFALATSVEIIKLPNDISAFVEGRSSIGRMGLFIQNAGWIDPGFEGSITLELYNASDVPIMLRAGTRIAQFVFAKMDRRCGNPYAGKYQGQIGTTESRIHQDED